MDRIIGIDYGSARTGLAVSDPLQIFASALETLPSAKIIEYLQKYSASETITLFVVGMPLELDGTPSGTAHQVRSFVGQLKKAVPGVRVHVPFSRGNRRTEGVLLAVAEESSVERPLKAILGVLDDRFTLNAKLKLAVQLLVAVLIWVSLSRGPSGHWSHRCGLY